MAYSLERKAAVVAALFKNFDGYLSGQGYIARGGQIPDASIVPVPKNRNTREESEPANATGSRERANAIKNGEVPEGYFLQNWYPPFSIPAAQPEQFI